MSAGNIPRYDDLVGDRQTQETWERIAVCLEAAFGIGVAGIAAFGSRARGTARPESDYDILLVAGGLAGDPFDRARQVQIPLLDLAGFDVRVVARTPAEFEADVTPLHLDLALDAVVLRDHGGYLATRLRRLRQLVAEAGIERGADLFWRWRVPPRRIDWAITWDGVRV